MGRTRTLADAGRELLRLYGREAARGVVAPAEDSGRVKFTPNKGPQTEATLTLADELYYGGSAGGGKSFLLCGLALTAHRNSLLLRRVSVDTKGLVDTLKSISPESRWKSVGYGGEMHTSDGRVIEVGGCQYEDDWKKYQGRAHDFCVARGTSILLDDGSYVPVEQVKTGDVVATLGGGRPVTRTISRGIRKCRSVRMGEHVTFVTDNHRMLTPSGWACPLDMEATLSGGDGNTSEVCAGSYSVFDTPSRGLSSWLPIHGHGLQTPACMAHREMSACSTGAETDSEASGGERLADQPPSPYYARLVLRTPAPREGLKRNAALCHPRGLSRVHDETQAVQGSLACCHGESCSCDEQSHPYLTTSLNDIPSPIGAVRDDHSGSNADGQPRIQGRIPAESRRYSHPYTKADLSTSEPCHETWVEIGPADDLEVFDLTVAEFSHYISYGGIIHSNCGFDELPTFTEKQYTTLIGWNRVADPVRFPNQRCRVVGAGNPPTDVAGEWVMKRFRAWLDIERGEKVRPGELRYYVVIDDKEEEFETGDPVEHQGKWYKPKSRTFIPARLEDNPALLATGYDATLESLPEPLRSMLRYGDFSTARVDDRWQLIPTAWVLAAQKRWAANRDKPLAKLSCVGVDVAMSKGKGDQTVIARRYGNRVGQLVKRAGSDTPDGQSVLMLILQALGGEDVDVNIDATGIGKSAYDMTQTTNPRMQKARAVMFGGAADYRDPLTPQLGFANVRSAMFWHLRQLLNPEGGPEDTRLELPPDGELLADLTAPRYSYRTGKVFVEPKDDGNGGGIRSRLGRSTDCGDACALSTWESRRPTIAFG